MRHQSLQRVRSRVVIHKLLDRLHQLGPWFYHRLWQLRKSRERISIEAPTAEIVASFRNFSKWASIIALVVGYHVLLGWIFDIRILKSPLPIFSTMKVNEAVCSILCGSALFMMQLKASMTSERILLAVRICAGLAALLAFLTLMEYLVGFPFGIDQWRFPIPVSHDGVQPGRMAMISAVAFCMVGVALVTLDRGSGYRPAETLALISGGIALLAIAGYLYQAEAFQGQMALYAALVIFLLSAGILCLRAERGLMARVASNSFGGIMARRLLPAALLIPIVLAWLQHEGHQAGLYSPEPGLALLAVADVALFVLVVWWGVNSLHRMDSKRRLAERQLQETAAKLARSNADLEQFAYVASHDLKEPLRAISGSVQILQERYQRKLDDQAEEIIRHTVDGATRMQTLIDDLLTYSRLTAREAPLEPTDCAEILQEVIVNLETAIKESKAVLTHDLLPVVRADRTQLLQVFQNLVSNGIKYRGERTLKLHVGAEDKGKEWLFSVRDNGIGIAPQYATRIFRIFQRLHTRKEYSGTGIGLAVCKKIVERHGGCIWLESEPDEGSTFFFSLPKHDSL